MPAPSDHLSPIQAGVLLTARLLGWTIAIAMVIGLAWTAQRGRAYFQHRRIADNAAVEAHKARVMDCMRRAKPPGLNWQQCDAIIHADEGYQDR